MLRLGFVVFLVTLVTLVWSTTARANGRFPEAQAMITVPGRDTVYLRTTFGLLVSRDRGRSWRFICERALGYDGTWDPPIAATADGRLWVGLEDGLATSHDGCSFARVPELAGHTVKDLAADGDTMWVITGAPAHVGYVWRIVGTTVQQRAAFADNLMTIEAVGERVYVSGQPYETVRGRLYRSRDGGRSFEQPPDAGAGALQADGPLFIGWVDRDVPTRMLVRHLHAAGSDLLLSEDAGGSWAQVLTMKSAMFGFAARADGRAVWAGSGLPGDGLHRSNDRGRSFVRVASHGVLCLHAAGDDLFACENTMAPGAPVVAAARGARDAGEAFVPLLRLGDVAGPLDCLDARAACDVAWADTLRLVRQAGPAPTGAADASTAAAAIDAAPPRRSRCSCDHVRPSPTDHGWAIVGLAGAATMRRRWRLPGSRVLRRVGRAEGAIRRSTAKRSAGAVSMPVSCELSDGSVRCQ